MIIPSYSTKAVKTECYPEEVSKCLHVVGLRVVGQFFIANWDVQQQLYSQPTNTLLIYKEKMIILSIEYDFIHDKWCIQTVCSCILMC